MRDAQAAAEQAARVAQRRLAAKLAGLSDTAKAVRSTGFRVPTLDEDPGADFPTNLWRFDDGRLRVRGDDGAVHEFVPTVDQRPQVPTFTSTPDTSWRMWLGAGSGNLFIRMADGGIQEFAALVPDASTEGGTGSSGGSTSTKPKPSDPRPEKFRETYVATWGRSFCPTHGVETSPDLYYGDSTWSTNHGFRRVMIGLDDAAIRADLAGAEIKRVEIKAHNAHAGPDSGVDIHWGAHNSSGPPGEFSAVRRNAAIQHWPKVGWGGGLDKWRDAPLYFGRALRDGNIRGLVIWQPSGSNSYYGAITWASISLRITAVK